MMFNLARARRKKVPPELFPAKIMHERKNQNREQNIRQDAERIGKLVSLTGKSPDDIMGDDKYWEYVRAYDKDYYRAVTRGAASVAPKAKEEAKNPSMRARYVPPFAPPKKKPQGSPMASSQEMTKTAAEQMTFLVREKGSYRLWGSLVGRLLKGWQQYLKEDGLAYALSMGSGDEAVPRIGPVAREALRVQEDLPLATLKAAREFLVSRGLDDAGELSRSVVAKALRTGKFDLTPLMVAASNVSTAMLLREGVHGIEEPGMVHEFRVALGKVMGPCVQRLTSALSMEGIDIQERRSSMPASSAAAQEALDQESSASPRLLPVQDIEESFDVPSLLLTATSQQAGPCPSSEPPPDEITCPDSRSLAADRLVLIMCRFPQFYDKHKLSPMEAERLPRSPALDRLRGFIKLYEADDAALMEAYSQSSGLDRLMLSHLVSSQQRGDIISSAPEMCLQETEQGLILNDSFLDALDPREQHVRSFIHSLLERANSGKVMALEKMLLRKMMGALAGSPDDRQLLAESLKASGSLYPLRLLAIALMLEGNKVEEAILEVARPAPGRSSGWAEALLAIALLRSGSRDAPRLAWEALRAAPGRVAFLGGRRLAVAYMRANRVGMDGKPIPEASFVLSAPDAPLPLAKSLAMMRDHQAMLVLLRLCAQRAKRGQGGDMFYPMRFLMDSLESMGRGGQAGQVLTDSKVRIDDENESVKRMRMLNEKPRRETFMLPDGTVVSGVSGMLEAHLPGRSLVRFASSSEDAPRSALVAIGQAGTRMKTP